MGGDWRESEYVLFFLWGGGVKDAGGGVEAIQVVRLRPERQERT